MITRGRLTLVLAVTLVAAALAGGAAAATTATPAGGHYAGSTRQGSAYRLVFAVAPGHIRNFTIGWKARCASGAILSKVTTQGATAVLLRHARFAAPKGTYPATIPGHPKLRGRFTVLALSGHFINATHARGLFRLHAQVLRAGTVIDTCDTGQIAWSAHRTG